MVSQWSLAIDTTGEEHAPKKSNSERCYCFSCETTMHKADTDHCQRSKRPGRHIISICAQLSLFATVEKEIISETIIMKNTRSNEVCPCSRSRKRRHNDSRRRRAAMRSTTIAMSLMTMLQYTDAFTTAPSSLSSTNAHRESIAPLAMAAVGGNKEEVNSNFSTQPLKSNKPLHRLTHQEEVSYLKQMRAYPGDSPLSQLARETLLLHNLPLVQSIVTKEMKSRTHLQLVSNAELKVGAALTRDDLLHEGTIGLAEALDRYDLAYAYTDADELAADASATLDDNKTSLPKGARLGTYATYWIRARIVRAIQSREHVIRFPERVLQASHRLVKAAKDMAVEWTDVIEMAEVAAAATVDSSSVSSKKQMRRNALQEAAGITSEFLFREAVRVRTMSTSGSHTPLESWMLYPAATSAGSDHLQEEEDEVEASPEHIRETLSKFLKPREVEVLSLRYGLITADEDEEVSTGVENAASPQRVYRNYEAEAEEDLFGPNGILSHYSDVPSEVKSVSPSAVSAVFSKKMTQGTIMPSKKKSLTAPTLLPFKEIGKRMKFSGEYCRRTCSAALNKLTQAAEEGRLAESDFLLGW